MRCIRAPSPPPPHPPTLLLSTAGLTVTHPNPPYQAAAGWTGEDGSAAPPRRRVVDFEGSGSGDAGDDAVGGGRGRASKRADESPVADESVAVIRDGDEAAEAAEARERAIADAPRNIAGRRVATLAELDGDRAGGAGALNASVSTAAGVDLSLLTASLFPPHALEEADEEWDTTYLLQRITQEMRSEGERREAAAAEDGVALPTEKSKLVAGAEATGPMTMTSAAGRTRAAA